MVDVGEDVWGRAWPTLYDSLGGNPWAAMPSLHFATSLLAAILLTESGPGRRASGGPTRRPRASRSSTSASTTSTDLIAGAALVVRGAHAASRSPSRVVDAVNRGAAAARADRRRLSALARPGGAPALFGRMERGCLAGSRPGERRERDPRPIVPLRRELDGGRRRRGRRRGAVVLRGPEAARCRPRSSSSCSSARSTSCCRSSSASRTRSRSSTRAIASGSRSRSSSASRCSSPTSRCSAASSASGSSSRWRESYEITMAGLAATRLFSAGGAGGIVLTYWALRKAGMPRTRVGRADGRLPRPPLRGLHAHPGRLRDPAARPASSRARRRPG